MRSDLPLALPTAVTAESLVEVRGETPEAGNILVLQTTFLRFLGGGA